MAYAPPPDRRPRGQAVPPPSGGMWGAPQAEAGSLAGLAAGAGPAPLPAPIVPPAPPAGAPPAGEQPPLPPDHIGDIPPPPLPSGMDMNPGMGSAAGGGFDMPLGAGPAMGDNMAVGDNTAMMGQPAAPGGFGGDPSQPGAQSGMLSPQDAAAMLARLAAGRGGA
jgi:hypothetical protein